MKFVSLPRVCDAERIIEVKPATAAEPPIKPATPMVIWLESGRSVVPDDGMLARYTPLIGDYFVTADDGYKYLNPKAVFEKHWRPSDQAQSA